MKTTLITGCSSGFGMLTAIRLASSGYSVFATMRNLGKKENWCVDGQRRGKLLPYNYEVETIGVSHISQEM